MLKLERLRSCVLNKSRRNAFELAAETTVRLRSRWIYTRLFVDAVQTGEISTTNMLIPHMRSSGEKKLRREPV